MRKGQLILRPSGNTQPQKHLLKSHYQRKLTECFYLSNRSSASPPLSPRMTTWPYSIILSLPRSISSFFFFLTSESTSLSAAKLGGKREEWDGVGCLVDALQTEETASSDVCTSCPSTHTPTHRHGNKLTVARRRRGKNGTFPWYLCKWETKGVLTRLVQQSVSNKSQAGLIQSLEETIFHSIPPSFYRSQWHVWASEDVRAHINSQ